MFQWRGIIRRVGVKKPLLFAAGLIFILFLLWSHNSIGQSSKNAPLAPLSYTEIPVVHQQSTAAKPAVSAPATSSSIGLSSNDYMLPNKASLIFTNMPVNVSAAQSSAVDMAARLLQFHKSGLQPVVILEPTNSQGPLNFANYRSGTYDSIISAYFQGLKNQDITDEIMGTWVYFPEADLPEWGPVDQTDYAPDVVRSVQIQKRFFPASRSGILLDAMSYPAGSTTYDNGSYTSLAPFINGIPAGLLDSFSLQGFPWAPPAGSGGTPNLDPSTFLNSSIAISAAKQLGIHSVWLNTGTYSAMYTNNPRQTITMDAAGRQAILAGIRDQAQAIKSAGFSVAVNLFSQDKSNTDEAINWSYGATEQSMVDGFARQLSAAGIGFWFFDS